MRPPELPRRLVDGQALEVAEDDRQAEGVGQPRDLAVQRLGLLAGHDRLLRPAGPSARPRTIRAGASHGVALLSLASASEPEPGAPRRPERDAVEPVAQQVGVADRAGLPGQDEESGLEGVLGRCRSPRSWRQTPRTIGPCRATSAAKAASPAASRRRVESLQELPVGEPGHGAALEERLDLPGHRRLCLTRHTRGLARKVVWDGRARRSVVCQRARPAQIVVSPHSIL